MGFRNPIGASDILTPGSVTSTILADGSVVTPKLANTAVTQPKTYPPISVGFPLFGAGILDYATTDINWQALRALKDNNGIVWVEGAIYNNSGSTYATGVTPIQLPVGYRPLKRHQFAAWASGAAAEWDVYNDGTCHLFIPGAGGWATGQTATVDGIRFYAG